MTIDDNQPTGAVTFLFTDIEDSTLLWDRHGSSMRPALAEHDALLKTTVESNAGVIVKTTGDGVMAAFASPSSALLAALDAQRSLRETTWSTIAPDRIRVRMGLHTGEAELRAGDYFGTAVNRAARLMSIGHGGQILVSEMTVRLIESNLPDDISLSNLGEHKLKGLVQPTQVFQVLAAFLPRDFPPLKSLGAALTNIPAQATPFVGRQEEVATVQALLAKNEIRLVTLIGPGGTGKTRLAIEVAVQQTPHFQDGVFFVALAPLGDAGNIVQAIIEAASITITSGDDLQTQLLRYLRRKQMLLVLDNFEHLLDGAQLLNDILEAAPSVTILATSREKLNLSGESVLALGGLQVNDWHTPEEVLAQSAGQLFVQSAQRTQPGFQLDSGDVPYVTLICQLSQGMPLAILLAASWVDTLSLMEIAAEIENSLDFLETELRDIPPRQRSIRAVFEGSWDKLAMSERELFKRLSVFRGGFTREAGEKVAGAGLRSLARLVNKSFLLRDPDSGRYTIHELLRQYGAERLEVEPNSAALTKEAHGAYFTNFMEQMLGALRSKRQREALDEIEADIENIRSAWRYFTEQGRAEEMARIIEPLWYFLEIRCWYHAGLDLFRSAEETLQTSGSGETSVVVLAQIKSMVGFFTSVLGEMDAAREMFEESLATLQALDCHKESLHPLTGLYVTYLFLNRGSEAIKTAQQVIEIAGEIGEEWFEADALGGLAGAYMWTATFGEARIYAEKSLMMWEQIGDPWATIWPEQVLAGLAAMNGNYTEARERNQYILDTAQSINFRRGIQYTYNSLGNVCLSMKQFQEAEAYYLQSLGISDEIGITIEILASFYDIARIHAATERASTAVEMLAIILKNPASSQHALFRQTSIKEDAESLCSELESRLSPETYTAAWNRGTKRELQSAVDEILADAFLQNRG